MKRPDRVSPWRWLSLVAITFAGLVSLVGSGGGIAIGFPPCPVELCPPAPPPLPSASVRPRYLTAQVGSPVSFTAVPANFEGTLSYQWRRSSDGVNYSDIAGATAATLTLAGVNLADDRATYQVSVRSSSGSAASAVAQLAVSASPGIAFADGELQPGDWITLADSGQSAFTYTDERLASGGNPGAWRRMSFTIPQGAGTARLTYAKPAAVYDPSAAGAIYVIDYAEDCINLSGSDLLYAEGGLVIEQGTRRYVWYTSAPCVQSSWTAAVGRNSLAARDFALVAGPACGAGESCPDFSAGGAALRFGYRRIAYGTQGNTVVHGIDNWRVTVWRR